MHQAYVHVLDLDQPFIMAFQVITVAVYLNHTPRTQLIHLYLDDIPWTLLPAHGSNAGPSRLFCFLLTLYFRLFLCVLSLICLTRWDVVWLKFNQEDLTTSPAYLQTPCNVKLNAICGNTHPGFVLMGHSQIGPNTSHSNSWTSSACVHTSRSVDHLASANCCTTAFSILSPC